jgi:EAL and modified HD-GYP domain-containing signal transduction protein
MKDVFVARQPIFDAKHRVQAYELLYRNTATAESAGEGESTSSMSSSVIVDGVLSIGLGRLTEGQKAFVNIPEQLLLDGLHQVLDPDMVVLELLETVQPTEEVVAACRQVKESGFRLALDDFSFDAAYAPLLELADVVKVDVIESGENLDALVEQLGPFGVQLLAEKVENADVHDRCVALGFELFQGFHYLRPETLSKKDAGTQAASILRLLSLLEDIDQTDRAIEEAFRVDPALSYKLLQIVNSAALGGRGVDSIGHAMRLLGRDPLHRWLSLLLLTIGRGGGEMRVEMIKSALQRGRMCELVGDTVRTSFSRDMPAGGTLFLVGLFSHLDALLGREMADILKDIDVTNEVKSALLEYEGKAGTLLRGVVEYTEAEWESAEEHLRTVGADPDSLGNIYMDAVAWAGAHMSIHDGEPYD